MKELTIEEKAKAYDEIIEKANKMHHENCEACQMCIEELIPELAESEDERIRRELIDFLEYYRLNNVLDSKTIFLLTDSVAWLEKQSEQKPMKTCAEYYNKDSELKMPELSVFQNKLADILMQREYEGSTETEEDVASARLDYELAAIRISEELLPLAIMQKPTEWSEEDKEIVKALNDYVKNLDILFSEIRIGDKDILSKEFREKVQLWLKFIKDRVQPKQQWSKEDERIKNNLLSELTNLSVRKLIEKETENKYVNWLKSLRPQNTWKPSDEQMNTLLDAIVYVEGCNSNFKGSGSVLEKLYNELKKLKE